MKPSERERLRSLYASAALAGLLASPKAGGFWPMNDAVKTAFVYAEKMLREHAERAELEEKAELMTTTRGSSIDKQSAPM